MRRRLGLGLGYIWASFECVFSVISCTSAN